MSELSVLGYATSRNKHVVLSLCTIFTARHRYASAALGVDIMSVCPSVCHMCAVWLIQRTCRWYFIPHEMSILLIFCHATVVGGRRPIPPKMGNRNDPTPPFKNRWRRQISACNVSTVRAGEQQFKLIMRNMKFTRAFQRAIEDVRTLPLSLSKGGSKNELFLSWIKLNFNWTKCATKFLR